MLSDHSFMWYFIYIGDGGVHVLVRLLKGGPADDASRDIEMGVLQHTHLEQEQRHPKSHTARPSLTSGIWMQVASCLRVKMTCPDSMSSSSNEALHIVRRYYWQVTVCCVC